MKIRFIRDTLPRESGSDEGFKTGDIPTGMSLVSAERWVRRNAAVIVEAVEAKPSVVAKLKKKAKAKAKAKR